jgi:aminoglycoside phosphotransferase (APT) family kinase protein
MSNNRLMFSNSTKAGEDQPDMLVHGDFTTSNTLFGAQGWSILDWARGSLAHPFFDVLLLMQDVANREVLTAVWNAYLEA